MLRALNTACVASVASGSLVYVLGVLAGLLAQSLRSCRSLFQMEYSCFFQADGWIWAEGTMV